MTKDDAISQVIELTRGQQGWCVLAADDPMTAMEGYVVFRNVDGEGKPIPEGMSCEDATEQIHRPQWPVFDKELEPLVNVVDSAKALLDFGRQYPDCVSCDDAFRKLLGFAHYVPEEGHALICQARLTNIKMTDDQFKADFLELREQKLQGAKEYSLTRQKEAAALAACLD